MLRSKYLASVLLGLLMLAVPAHAAQVQEVNAGGINAWLVEEHSVPVISLSITFKNAGIASDPAGKEGRAAFAAKMLMEGAGEHDARAFREALDARAIRLDSDVSSDLFTVKMETLSEHAGEAFALLGEALSRPQLAPDAIERVRGQMQAGLRELNENPSYLSGYNWQKAAYKTHPYATPEYGTPESITAMAQPDLDAFFGKYLTRGNIVIGVAGDITPRELESWLEEYLGELPVRFEPAHLVEDTVIATSGEWVQVPMDVPQSVVMFGRQGLTRQDPDFYAAYLLSQVLGGGGLTSRLSESLRKDSGLVYYVGTQLETKLHAQSFTGAFASRSDGVDEAIAKMEAELRRMQKDGITQAEFDDALSYAIGSFPLQLDNNGDIASFLTTMQLFDLGIDYLDKRNEYFRSVTLAQVNAVAARMLDPQNMILVRVGPLSKKEK